MKISHSRQKEDVFDICRVNKVNILTKITMITFFSDFCILVIMNHFDI